MALKLKVTSKIVMNWWLLLNEKLNGKALEKLLDIHQNLPSYFAPCRIEYKMSTMIEY